jgi:PilZ domain
VLSPNSNERRRSPRYPLRRLAKMQPKDGSPQRYCHVIDGSDGGVRLHLYGFDVSSEFLLTFSGDGPSNDGTYKVIWRDGSEVGAMYMGPAAPDA